MEGELCNITSFGLTQNLIEVRNLVIKEELDFKLQFKVEVLENQNLSSLYISNFDDNYHPKQIKLSDCDLDISKL